MLKKQPIRLFKPPNGNEQGKHSQNNDKKLQITCLPVDIFLGLILICS